MKKALLLAVFCNALALIGSAYADEGSDSLLNKVVMQLKAEQWLVTKTALVTVQVNAGVNDQGIDKIQNEVMQKLAQVSNKTEWHIISFNRQQDKSGLESIGIRAQARVSQSDLAGIRNSAKSISKQGETYTIENVEFTPTFEEINIVNESLRTNIYQQAKHEIDILNNTYTSQHYYLHQIDFVQPPHIMPMAAYATKAAAPAAPLSVGNKAELQATVVLASTPEFPTNLSRVTK